MSELVNDRGFFAFGRLASDFNDLVDIVVSGDRKCTLNVERKRGNVVLWAGQSNCPKDAGRGVNVIARVPICLGTRRVAFADRISEAMEYGLTIGNIRFCPKRFGARTIGDVILFELSIG